ncbi:MAG: hypothetical protein AAF388_27605 [Bacteroidota bacterium]
MSLFPQTLPIYVSLIFLLVIPIPIFMIANLGRRGIQQSTEGASGKIVFWAVLLFYGVYLLYTTIAAFQGWFVELSLPPKILLFTTLPLLIFLLVVISSLPVYKRILSGINTSELIRLHIFRLIGSFFLILTFYGTLPGRMGFLAGFGDLITAISSIWVAKVVSRKSAKWKAIALAWNTFGFLDIIATSVTAFILTKISIETGTPGVEILGEFPFCFIPAFAPTTIIFLHVSIYRKLLRD